ncbi:MAG TPA: uroporphyrinogen-III synthase, partial [Trichormus sp.]
VELAKLLKPNSVDIIILASSESVKNFVELAAAGLGDSNDCNIQSLVNDVVIASIGSETSKACRRHLGKVDLEAVEHTTEGLVSALLQNACHHK